MSISKDDIIALPNEHLRQRSKKVGAISPAINQLITDMQTATIDWENSRQHEVGVALAAIQIDKPLRVVVIRHNFDDKTNQDFDIYINPSISKYEGELEEDFEGCLSVPEIYGKVPRYNKVHIRALDTAGKPIKVIAEGFLARVFQHEIDHTNGLVFIDHIKDSPEAFFHLETDGQLTPLDYKKDILGNTALWTA